MVRWVKCNHLKFASCIIYRVTNESQFNTVGKESNTMSHVTPVEIW